MSGLRTSLLMMACFVLSLLAGCSSPTSALDGVADESRPVLGTTEAALQGHFEPDAGQFTRAPTEVAYRGSVAAAFQGPQVMMGVADSFVTLTLEGARRDGWTVVGPPTGSTTYRLPGLPEDGIVASHHAGALLQDAWPGIDLVFHEDAAGNLEHDYIVDANTDEMAIRFSLDMPAAIDPLGNLLLEPGLAFAAPRAWQGNQELPAKFIQLDTAWGYKLEGRDPSRPVLIDPLLVVDEATFGGAGTDEAATIEFHAAHLYLGGRTNSPAFLGMATAGYDAFVAVLGLGGPIWECHLVFGGTDADEVNDIEVGNIFPIGDAVIATGTTWSHDYHPQNPGFTNPAGASAFYAAFDQNCVVPGAPAVPYLEFFTGNCGVESFAFGGEDTFGNDIHSMEGWPQVIIAGTTSDQALVRYANAPQPNFGGGATDAFLSVMVNGCQGADATYFGSGADEEGLALTGWYDSNFDYHVLLGGSTDGALPAPHAATTECGGGGGLDGFVVLYEETPFWAADDVSAVLHGSSNDDAITDLDTEGNPDYLMAGGWTEGDDWCLTHNLHGGMRDGFYTKLTYSTGGGHDIGFIGGAQDDEVRDIDIDADVMGIVGWTESVGPTDGFPTTAGASSKGSLGRDGFAVQMPVPFAPGWAMDFSTLDGGVGDDDFESVVIRPLTTGGQEIWAAGWTDSPDFVMNPGPGILGQPPANWNTREIAMTAFECAVPPC